MLKYLLLKDFRCFSRARGFLPAIFSFSLLLVVVASFSFRRIGYSRSDLLEITPGIIWLIFLFIAVSILTQSFVVEKENRALVGLLLSKVKLETLFFSKFVVNSLMIFSAQALVIFFHGIFFGLDLLIFFLPLMLISFLAAVSFSSLGTLFSFISVYSRGRELLLPLLLFPLLIPLLASVVFLTRQVFADSLLDYSQFWFLFLCIFASLSFFLALLLFEYAVRD